MKKSLHRFFTLFLAVCLGFEANAQDFDLLLLENFDATTIPAGWVSSVADPADPALGGPSGGWEFGVTGYTGAWVVPASLDATGFAISNDDQDPASFGTDRSEDFLGVGLFDMTNYDSLTILFDRFFSADFGSSGFVYIDNGIEPIIIPIGPASGAWVEDGLTIANGEVLIADPWVFTSDVVIGFLHNDNGDWGDGLAIDNAILAGWLAPCETTGLTQMPASPVAAVGGSTTTISTMQNTGGQFSVITNVQGSTEYVIDHSGGSYVTVRTGSASGPVLDFGDTPLTITTLSTDDLYIIWSDDQFCTSGGGTGTNTSTITGGAQVCAADAGVLFASSGSDACLGDELVAASAIAPSVPSGFTVAYVITDGAGTIVDGPFANSTYTPAAEGTFVIHTIVYDPADEQTILGTVVSSSGSAVAVGNLFEENGGQLCGSLDLTGATFTVVDCPDNNDCEDATPLECGVPVAGTNVNGSLDVTGLGETVWYTFQGNGQNVTFSNCNNGDFDSFFALWTGECGNIENIAVNDDGIGCTGFTSELTWYAHPDTLYYLSVSGLSEGEEGTFTLSATCACPIDLSAGSLTPNATTACLDENGEAVLSATEGTAPQVPAGYDVAYVLTSGGTDYIIEQTGATPEFTVTAGGEYTIHTLVFTNTLDLGVVVPGTTPASAVLDIVTNDDNICAALDVQGSGSIIVNAPEVGATVADASEVCLLSGTADIGGESDGNEVVPAGYAVAYVLTDADANLTILDANATGDFTVTSEGNYVIHTLVYDPAEITAFGPLVGLEGGAVAALLFENGGTTYCASLDVAGAPITVVDCSPPANDLCGDAEAISCDETLTGNSTFATSQGADLSFCETSFPTDAPGVWYEFAGNGDIVTVSTCSQADFDTKIGVFSGACGAFVCEAGNDDGTGCSGFTSETTFESTQGETYFIYITGFDSDEFGEFDVTVTCVSPPDPLANDVPCDAILLDEGVNGSYTNVGATSDSWETGSVPAGTGATTCNSQDGWCSFELDVDNSTWFSFVAPASGRATISVEGFDTQAALFSGASCQDIAAGNGTLIGANDDGAPGSGSFLALCDLNPGETYFLMVDGYSGAEGTYTVTLTEQSVEPSFTSSATGLVVDFTDASLATSTIVDWAWDFGDGGTSDEEDPQHTYTADDTYTVCLTVTDENGCSEDFCNDVTVSDITTSITEALNRGMLVYPNPSNGEFVVEVNGVDAMAQLNVMDLTGRVVYTEGAMLNGNFRRDLNLDVVSGTYLLQVVTEEGTVTRKLQVK